jgi:hypothetical protein
VIRPLLSDLAALAIGITFVATVGLWAGVWAGV